MSTLFELAPAYQLPWHLWIVALLVGVIIGGSKAGIKGIGVFIVTIMAYLYGGRASTGIVLPLFMAGGVLAVWYYDRHAQWKYIIRLLPWMVIGVLIGVFVGKDLPEVIFKRGMAVIILLSVVMMFWWERNKTRRVPDNLAFAGLMGLCAGFTTMIGNLAGAFTNLFFLAIRLPKDQFIGTAAWLFFIINIFKLPFHIFVWETVTLDSFAVNLRLIPGLLIGFYMGTRLVHKIKDQAYRKMILFLTALGAIVIFFR